MADLDILPKSPLAHSRRHSRRNTGNINFSHLSLSPLTSASITEQDFKRKDEKRRSGSYIQGLSAPTTPGILSRNHSFISPRGSYSGLPKSKSSSQLLLRSCPPSNQWLQRTGAALTSEARESKGQSWLVSRASSTSLVKDGEDDDSGSVYYVADDEFSPSASGRRLSRTFSNEYFEDGLEVLDEEAISARGEKEEGEEEYDIDLPRGFGLGQFVDRLIGWSVFAEDDTDDEESLDGYEDERRLTKAKRERVKVESPSDQTMREQQRRLRDEGDGWQDPAWIFSIASQVFL